MRPRKSARALHLLASSVIQGETTEFPWAALREIYFPAHSKRRAARHLAEWAAEHGIGVTRELRPPTGHDPDAEWVRFRVERRSPAED